MIKNTVYSALLFSIIATLIFAKCTPDSKNLIDIQTGDHIVLVGNNLCSRMINFGHFETEIQMRFPDDSLIVRNMCDGGNTPGFRPHSGRYSPWAFPGAERFHDELANFSNSQGHFETPDQWLTKLEADVVLAFFGYNESFAGEAGIENFEKELEGFVEHSKNQEYNGSSSPKLVLVSPLAFENLSDKLDLPDGKAINSNLQSYTNAIQKIAKKTEVEFIDIFSMSKKWFSGSEALTIDGFQLNDDGYQKLGLYLAENVFNEGEKPNNNNREKVNASVLEKDWFWHEDYKSPNGVHVFGRRYNPFGPDNYPDEIKKKREMTSIRDTAIWMSLKGIEMDLSSADSKTHTLSKVETNYKPDDYGRGTSKYYYGEEAVSKLTTPSGYNVELFASEKEFPDLANPVQIAFDNKGRLWVAVMPTYPHYKPGDPKPNDKIIILEDTDGDNKADKQTIFVENLHIPAGFEISHDGVYISQGTNLKLYKDTDGDDKADYEEIILSGFDDHDSHHVISAFCADPSGAFYMCEGVFLHTNVETSYGPVRGTNGGFYRYNPQRRHLERAAQLPIPNPWGLAFDDWGQLIYLETSGPAVRWMLPGSIKSRYGQSSDQSPNLVEQDQQVRPTSGAEIVSSGHFPDEVQGDFLLNNAIGFLGTKQHQIVEDGTGFKFKFRQDLLSGSDQNFRPVDMEFAPDGSLYLVDWHNVLIGHMQHNARDPLRDHVHGRIYRVTYPSRPLVTPAHIDGAPIATLLDNLKLHEYRTRYRTKRELRGRDHDEVYTELKKWVTALDRNDSNYEHQLVEALWVIWGSNQVDNDLLEMVMNAQNFKARCTAVRFIKYMGYKIPNRQELLKKAASDQNGRVRLEALVAASWLNKEDGLDVLDAVKKGGLDDWSKKAYDRAYAHLNGENLVIEEKEIRTHLEGDDRDLYIKGKELYNREAYCGTCHQEQGQGLSASGYPPLRRAKWVTGNEDRLIKLTLKGIYGPISVLRRDYKGNVPMTPFEGLMTDDEIAAVLTYVRNSFGNRSSVISPERVKTIREEIKDKKGFFTASELLKIHPFED
jgi:mono/diheme cytochrome c family protein/glucose/arabinose dehydrogenase